MKQDIAICRGEISPSRVTSYFIPEVKVIRARVGMKQNEFSQAIGVSPAIVQSWEQHKRIPQGSNLKMLRILEKNPDVLQMFIQA